MAGYASNKYSLLGLRAAAQSISYEIPFALSVLAVVMMSNSKQHRHRRAAIRLASWVGISGDSPSVS